MKKLRTEIFDTDKQLEYLFISYERDEGNIKILRKKLINIYKLNTDLLAIGNIGNGQLQIKNYNRVYY